MGRSGGGGLVVVAAKSGQQAKASNEIRASWRCDLNLKLSRSLPMPSATVRISIAMLSSGPSYELIESYPTVVTPDYFSARNAFSI